MWSLAEPELLADRGTILLIPSREEGLRDYAQALEEDGYQTMVPPNPQASLSRLRWASLVIMSLGQDDTEAWGLFRNIRKRFPSLPIVGFSGAGAEDLSLASMSIGAVDHLFRPIEPRMLSARIHSHIERARDSDQRIEAGERFRRLVMSTPIPLFVIEGGWFRIANDPLGDFVGMSVEKVLADRNIVDLVVEEDQAVLTRAMSRGNVSGDGSIRIALRIRREGGESREAELALVPLDGPARELYAGTLLDISRRSRAVRKGQKKEEYFRSLIEGVHDIIALIDVDGRIRYTSPSAERVLGYENGQAIGESLLKLVHEKDRRPVRKLIRRLTQSPDAVVTSRCRVKDVNGGWKVLEFTARDLLGMPAVEGVVINARDVTEQQKSEDALRDSESRFRLMVEGSPDVFFYVRRPDGQVVYLSPSVESVLGFPADELTGRSVEWMRSDAVNEAAVNSAERLSSLKLVRASNRDGRNVLLELVESPMPGDDELVQGFARDVSERERLQGALRDAAFRDALTGLPNRALFTDRVRHAITRVKRHPEHAFAMLFLDLDRFKIINDSLGHRVGDHLLVAVSERLQQHLRPGDTLARFGGDEFAILLEDIDGPSDAPRIAERISEVLGVPFNLGGYEVYTSASIGIVMGSPIGDTPDSLLQNADMAMYRAKAGGGNAFEMYDQPMHAEAVRRLELESQLRRAVDRDELRLHYQPIIDLTDGRIVGTEALLRWEHPIHGLIAPGDFIGLAEETGFINAIGEWVLDAAAGKLSEWRKALALPDLFVSVNLSSRQLRDSSILDHVRSAIDSHGITPENLKLEITESTMIHGRGRADRVLRELMNDGVNVYLDDFGTGYASLSYLQSLPLKGLKIDRSFVTRMHDDGQYGVLVSSTMDIARGLGLNVVAEGIEQASHAHTLTSLGCRYAQGYHFSRPLPPDQVERLLAAPSQAIRPHGTK